MRYEGKMYRPPSEANAYILQATIGCSWNNCVYCDMYSDKTYRVRPLKESLHDIDVTSAIAGDRITKVFIADGDALGMPMDHWRPILAAIYEGFPAAKRVSCYAMARNVAAKTDAELAELAQGGLTRLYIGPESGHDTVLKRIAKGDTAEAHVNAAVRAHAAGMELSVIALLGVAGVELSQEHARATADLVTAMNPDFFAALTTTVVPGTPLARLQQRGRFELPTVPQMLMELRTMIDLARPTDAMFRTNHASNYLPLAGRIPRDRAQLVRILDRALEGDVRLRPERTRGL
jgi:radical SAM superfamily enzyme YgiQ (UPF0313 family)